MSNEVEQVQVAGNDRLENEDSMVFDLCFGWVPIEDVLMGTEDFIPSTVHAETPLLGDRK